MQFIIAFVKGVRGAFLVRICACDLWKLKRWSGGWVVIMRPGGVNCAWAPKGCS